MNPAQPQIPPEKAPSFLEQMMPLFFIFAIIYLLLIRPSQKRIKKHNEFVEKVKKGDRVVTASGIVGTIDGTTENYVTLEIADKVKIKILRNQISSFLEESKQPSSQKK